MPIFSSSISNLSSEVFADERMAVEQEFASFYSRKMLSPAKSLRPEKESIVGYFLKAEHLR